MSEYYNVINENTGEKIFSYKRVEDLDDFVINNCYMRFVSMNGIGYIVSIYKGVPVSFNVSYE